VRTSMIACWHNMFQRNCVYHLRQKEQNEGIQVLLVRMALDKYLVWWKAKLKR